MLIRPLVGEARFYAAVYVLLAACAIAATTPGLSFAFQSLAWAVLLGLFVAWRESRAMSRRQPTWLGRDTARFEDPLARLGRRLRLVPG